MQLLGCLISNQFVNGNLFEELYPNSSSIIQGCKVLYIRFRDGAINDIFTKQCVL